MVWQQFLPEPPVRKVAAAGECLLSRGTVPPHALHVKSGRVACGQMENGALKHRLVTVDGPSWIEIGCVLLKQPSPADWVAESEVELQLVPSESIRRWFAEQPAPTRALVRDAAQVQRLQTEATLAMLVQDAEARCAQWLLRHAEVSDQGSVAVPMREPKRAIAAQLGIAPETLSRVLRSLRESGLISQTGSVMNLIDPPGLRAVAAR